MKIALLGATGRTGRLVLAEALQRGHEVTALVRRRADLPGEGFEICEGDVRDPGTLAQAIAGADAVVSAVGARGRDANLHTELAQHTMTAMQPAGVRRFVGISVAGLDLPGDRKGTRDKIIGRLARTLAGSATADRLREYETWAHSGLDWTLVRVPRLVDGEAGSGPAVDPHLPPRGIALNRASLAALLVECAVDERWVGAAPFAADR